MKCTGKLQPLILQAGGSPIMWKTGHSLIKAKMRETDAALAGEMSGHFFFKERWYGFDDGIYAAARLLEILAADVEGRTPQQIFASLPKGVSTPELKIQMAEGEHYAFIERFQKKAKFEGARVTTHRWRARGLAGRLGPGARVEHHAGAGVALRCRHRRRAEAHPGCVPQAAQGSGSETRVAVLAHGYCEPVLRLHSR